MKKAICMLLALVMVLSLAACGGDQTGGGTTSPSPAVGNSISDKEINKNTETDDTGEDTTYWSDTFLRDKVTVATTADAGDFNPIVKGQGWGAINLGIFQRLLATRSDGSIDLALLKSYEMVDELTYECEIWDFITDSEGNPFTTRDIEYCRDWYISQGLEGRAGFSNLADLEVIDEFHFVWHCKEPYPKGGFATALVSGYYWTQAAMEEIGAENFFGNPIGTGPYALESYIPGASVTLVANENYWMKHITDEEWLETNLHADCIQNVREIEFQIIQDAASRAIALEMGTVDAVTNLNAADVIHFEENPSMNISPVLLASNSPCTFYFDVNEQSPCSDANLRKAICYALDNEGISKATSLPSYAAKCWNSLIWDAPEGWTDGLKTDGTPYDYYDYNIDLAREYLEQSSYSGETLKIMYENSGVVPDVAVMMKSQLAEVGINVELINVDKGIFDTYKLDYTKWDILFDMVNGSCYYADAIKKFWTVQSAPSAGGMQPIGIIDEHWDELYLDVFNVGDEASMEAWDQYTVYEQCYLYGVVGYYEMTACSSSVNCVVEGKQNALTPGAFTYND